MKILLLTDGIVPYVIGGMQKHSFHLAKNLAEQGHTITLVHCVDHHSTIPDLEDLTKHFGALAMSNLDIICIKFPIASWYPGHYLKESYVYSSRIYEKLQHRLADFDFIYAKGFTAWFFMEKKKKGANIPPIGIKFHGYEMFQPSANFKSRIHKWLLRSPTKWNNLNADFVFSYGGKITNIITNIGVDRNKIIEIPTGIEASWCLDKPASLGENIRRFIFIGRYERRKGIEELSAVLRNLIKTENFRFDFIGPIPSANRISSDKIKYHGSMNDKVEIQRILDGCSVMVVPSHSEGMPNVIMEGMARGLAILATDVGAVSTIVNADNGWFVNPGDVTELESKMKEIMLLNTSEISKKQQNSCDQIKTFFWGRIAEMTSLAMQKCLKQVTN